MPIALEQACIIVRELRRRLEFSAGARARVRARLVPVGSLRRREPLASDIDLLVVVPDGADSGDLLARAVLRAGGRARAALEIAGDRCCGPRRRTMLLSGGALHRFPVDLFLVRESELPFALFHYTGSRAYNIRTRAHAKRLGWTLNQYGLFDRAGRRVRGTRQIRTEAEIADRLGISHRAATDRKK